MVVSEEKGLEKLLTTTDDDRHQMMAIAHIAHVVFGQGKVGS